MGLSHLQKWIHEEINISIFYPAKVELISKPTRNFELIPTNI